MFFWQVEYVKMHFRMAAPQLFRTDIEKPISEYCYRIIRFGKSSFI